MANYIFSVKSIKYGTPTGSNTMPVSGNLTLLPNTVKDSVTIEMSDSVVQEFFVDQRAEPIKTVITEMPKLTAVAQFYDMDYVTIAAMLGGTGNASGWVPAVGFTQVEKAIEIELDSGHKIDMYNAHIDGKVLGGGGRSSMFAFELKMNPQMTTDLAGSYKIKPA